VPPQTGHTGRVVPRSGEQLRVSVADSVESISLAIAALDLSLLATRDADAVAFW